MLDLMFKLPYVAATFEGYYMEMNYEPIGPCEHPPAPSHSICSACHFLSCLKMKHMVY